MTRGTDYIVGSIYRQHVNDVRLVSGGGMMVLSDDLAQHPQWGMPPVLNRRGSSACELDHR